MSQPSNTIPGCGAQTIDSVFSAIQKEFRRIQNNSEEFRENLDRIVNIEMLIYMFLDRI
jgi:hypothetical protein